jgi:hypothetical protein
VGRRRVELVDGDLRCRFEGVGRVGSGGLRFEGGVLGRASAVSLANVDGRLRETRSSNKYTPITAPGASTAVRDLMSELEWLVRGDQESMDTDGTTKRPIRACVERTLKCSEAREASVSLESVSHQPGATVRTS